MQTIVADPTDIESLSGGVHDTAGRLATVGRALRSADPSAAGEPVLSQALAGLAEAWNAGLREEARHAEVLAQGLRAAAAAYRRTEQSLVRVPR